MKRMNTEEGFTGLEAAIVLIAFVVVAAVFSYVVLGAGFFTTQKAQEVVYTSVDQASSSVEILGQVYGYANGTSPYFDVNKIHLFDLETEATLLPRIPAQFTLKGKVDKGTSARRAQE